MTKEIEIKKSTIYILGIVILVVIAGYFMFNNISAKENLNGNVAEANSNGELQKINLGIRNYNYYPNTIKVKANQPVEITLDNTVSGCLRSFTIKDLGVNKYSKNPSDKIIFTPDKKGTFRFACSMGMGTGTIIVE